MTDPSDPPLPVVRASDLDTASHAPRWLIESLWTASGVGVLGGAPKSMLCRVRHNMDHPASRIMPRDWVSMPRDP